jgi:hypothetical protein
MDWGKMSYFCNILLATQTGHKSNQLQYITFTNMEILVFKFLPPKNYFGESGRVRERMKHAVKETMPQDSFSLLFFLR